MAIFLCNVNMHAPDSLNESQESHEAQARHSPQPNTMHMVIYTWLHYGYFSQRTLRSATIQYIVLHQPASTMLT